MVKANIFAPVKNDFQMGEPLIEAGLSRQSHHYGPLRWLGLGRCRIVFPIVTIGCLVVCRIFAVLFVRYIRLTDRINEAKMEI